MLSPEELRPSSVAGRIKMVRIPCGARKQVVFRMVDDDGAPVKLTKEVINEPAVEPRFSTGRPVSAGRVVIRLRAADDYNGGKVFDVVGKVINSPSDDMVEFLLEAEHTSKVGVFLAEVGQFVDDQLIQRWICYICVEPSVFQTLDGSGPLTIPEIRLALLDLENDEVSLLDDLEFTDVQIAQAMRRTVDLWNETPPPIQRYTASDFPYRYHWTIGTVAYLLDAAAARYRRNRLSYSAGGINIDDQNKSQEYQEVAQAKKEEFRTWMMLEKIRLNMEATWASF